jgi:aldehyde:ferredoxin oxidoreductase
MELPQHSHYRIGWALGAAVSERGDQLRASTPVIGPIIGPMLKRLPNLAVHGTVEGFIQKNYPREFWETLADEHAYEGKPSLLVYQERSVAHIPDILGLCKFMVGQLPFSYFKVDGMVKFLSSVTGMEMDRDLLNIYCERMSSLIRAFNIREGVTRKDDTIPDMFFSKPSIVTGVPLDRKKFDEMVGEVYSLHGWDENGIPTRNRLEELGIQYVADDLEERGLG